MSNQPLITIITPTMNRDSSIIQRCIDSVNGQSYENWEHIIVSDCPKEDHVIELAISSKNSNKRHYIYNDDGPSNTWGAYPRKLAMKVANKESKYYVFLDDDNILLSHHLRTMVEIIHNKKVAICKIYHHGPLNREKIKEASLLHEYEVAYLLSGTPPELFYIDTLNIMVDKDTMDECGWVCNEGANGYCNDGYTYNKLFYQLNPNEWVSTDEILAIHK